MREIRTLFDLIFSTEFEIFICAIVFIYLILVFFYIPRRIKKNYVEPKRLELKKKIENVSKSEELKIRIALCHEILLKITNDDENGNLKPSYFKKPHLILLAEMQLEIFNFINKEFIFLMGNLNISYQKIYDFKFSLSDFRKSFLENNNIYGDRSTRRILAESTKKLAESFKDSIALILKEKNLTGTDEKKANQILKEWEILVQEMVIFIEKQKKYKGAVGKMSFRNYKELEKIEIKLAEFLSFIEILN